MGGILFAEKGENRCLKVRRKIQKLRRNEIVEIEKKEKSWRVFIVGDNICHVAVYYWSLINVLQTAVIIKRITVRSKYWGRALIHEKAP